MKETLASAGIMLAIVSVIAFFIGFLMLFWKSQQKLGVKILVSAIIGFIIGFGTCLANFSMGNMH